jgi:hypothetical protein
LPGRKLVEAMRSSRRPARDSASGIVDACGPKSPALTGWSGASPHVLRFPLRAFLRFPVCPPGSSPSPAVLWFPFVRRSPVRSLRPLPGSGSPSASLRVPFPLSNLYISAAARRFPRRWSRAAGTNATSSTTPLGSRDPPARRMGSGCQRPSACRRWWPGKSLRPSLNFRFWLGVLLSWRGPAACGMTRLR